MTSCSRHGDRYVPYSCVCARAKGALAKGLPNRRDAMDSSLKRRKVLVRVRLEVLAGAVGVTLLVGVRESRRKRRGAEAQRRASAAPTVCFDVGSFASMMSCDEISALARQLVLCYGCNRSLQQPFALALAFFCLSYFV